MMRRLKFGAAMLALALFTLPTLAQADLVLNVDLTVTDEITISALGGLSTSTVSGSDTTGFYLEDIYGGGAGGITETLVAGDLTSAANASDLGPDLFSIDAGLNVFSYTADPTSDFTAGALAFSGSGNWTITAADYAALLAGSDGGTVWAIADDFSDIPAGGGTAVVIGEYVVKKPGAAIPEPTSLAFVALGTVGLAFRRRRA